MTRPARRRGPPRCAQAECEHRSAALIEGGSLAHRAMPCPRSEVVRTCPWALAVTVRAESGGVGNDAALVVVTVPATGVRWPSGPRVNASTTSARSNGMR